MQAVVAEYRARHPGDVLTVFTGMRSPDRVLALTAGTADVAVLDEDVSPDTLRSHDLVRHEIARSVMVFAIHPGVPLQQLTRRQLCDIYAGRVTNWRDLGGPDLRIRAGIRMPAEDDTRDPLAPLRCDAGFRYAVEVQAFERVEELAEATSKTPGGIALTSLAAARRHGAMLRMLAVEGVAPSDSNVQRGAYPFTREIILVTRRTAPAAFDRLLAFIAGEHGQRIIRAEGAVPMLKAR